MQKQLELRQADVRSHMSSRILATGVIGLRLGIRLGLATCWLQVFVALDYGDYKRRTVGERLLRRIEQLGASFEHFALTHRGTGAALSAESSYC